MVSGYGSVAALLYRIVTSNRAGTPSVSAIPTDAHSAVRGLLIGALSLARGTNTHGGVTLAAMTDKSAPVSCLPTIVVGVLLIAAMPYPPPDSKESLSRDCGAFGSWGG